MIANFLYQEGLIALLCPNKTKRQAWHQQHVATKASPPSGP